MTERAVFQLVEDGIELMKLLGVDLQHDVLDKLSFQPLIADKHTLLIQTSIVNIGNAV